MIMLVLTTSVLPIIIVTTYPPLKCTCVVNQDAEVCGGRRQATFELPGSSARQAVMSTVGHCSKQLQATGRGTRCLQLICALGMTGWWRGRREGGLGMEGGGKGVPTFHLVHISHISCMYQLSYFLFLAC